MLKHGSASVHEQSPHANEHLNQTTKPATTAHTPGTLDPALKRSVQAIVNDKSSDAESRAIIRFALEINDTWLSELVQRVDAGENIAESFDYSQAAALLVLMRTLENSAHAKLLANKAKRLAFTRCAEANLLGMVDTQIAVIEGELAGMYGCAEVQIVESPSERRGSFSVPLCLCLCGNAISAIRSAFSASEVIPNPRIHILTRQIDRISLRLTIFPQIPTIFSRLSKP